MADEYYDQPPMPPPQPYSFSSPMQMYGSNILLLTDPEDELNKMELTLRNCYKNADGKIVEAGEPLLNEDGIRSVMGQVQTIVNQVTIMSNLDDKEVNGIRNYLGYTLGYDLMMNRTKYGIKNRSARKKIYFTALTSAHICMKRAVSEGERRFIGRAQQEITHNVQGQQQRKGLLDRVFGRNS